MSMYPYFDLFMSTECPKYNIFSWNLFRMISKHKLHIYNCHITVLKLLKWAFESHKTSKNRLNRCYLSSQYCSLCKAYAKS